MAKRQPKPEAGVEEVGRVEVREVRVAASGRSIWDIIFAFLLALLDFILKALGKITKAAIIRPLQGFSRWLFKKPLRVLFLILLLLLLYAIAVNWDMVAAALARLKLS